MAEKITLKGGYATEDPRLDRVPRFDRRSRNYSAVDVEIKRKKPRSYSWNFPKATGNPYLDQGMEGACVGFSAGNELVLRPAVVEQVTPQMCREQIYWEAQRTDPWEGGAYPGASPRYEGTAVIDGAKAVRKLGYIGGYQWAFGIDDAIMALGYKGPIIFGIRWYDGMFNTDAKGFITPTGRHRGDHAIVGNIINMKEEWVGLPNSWGADWGVDGMAKIRLADLDWLLRRDGEACVYLKRKKKA